MCRALSFPLSDAFKLFGEVSVKNLKLYRKMEHGGRRMFVQICVWLVCATSSWKYQVKPESRKWRGLEDAAARFARSALDWGTNCREGAFSGKLFTRHTFAPPHLMSQQVPEKPIESIFSLCLFGLISLGQQKDTSRFCSSIGQVHSLVGLHAFKLKVCWNSWTTQCLSSRMTCRRKL